MLKSPEFVVENSGDIKLRLHLYRPKGDPNDITANRVCVFLLDANNCFPNRRFIYNLTVLPMDGSSQIPKGAPLLDFSKDNFEFVRFLLDDDFKKEFLPRDILTIRCRLFYTRTPITSEQLNACRLHSSFCCKTTVNIHRTVFIFPFNKISELLEGQDQTFSNQHNSTEDTPPLRFLFHINQVEADQVQINILKTRPSRNEDLLVKCKITVVCANKEHQTSQEDLHFFSSSNENDVWNFPAFISTHNLAAGVYTFVDNIMYLQCEVTFSHKGDEHHSWIPMCNVPGLPEISNSIVSQVPPVNELSKGVPNGDFCDVEVRTGEQSFSCHKLVLCQQSPVFSAMFNENSKDKRTGIVQIPDLDPQTFQGLLKFMYSEVIEDGLSVEDICKLYSAAGQYKMTVLKRRCALLLLSKLCVTNVCSVLTTADKHQDHFLCTHIYTYLRNHSKEIFYLPQWKEFMVDNPTLSKETMFKILMDEPLA